METKTNMEMEKYRLGEIADYVTDKISSKNIQLEDYVTTDSLLQNKTGRQFAQNLPPIETSLIHYKTDDVLIANIRPYLKKIWKADREGGCSSDVLVFRAKEGHNSNFLYALLMHDAFYDYVMRGTKGSQMPRGDKEQIMRYEIPMFSPVVENNIGNLINVISEKIALNRQMNDTLEAMAKQLYDYWFVQFDFPDKDGKPYKSSGGAMVWNETLKREIPEGWEVKKYSQICNLNLSTLSKKDAITQIEYLDTSNLVQGDILELQSLSRQEAPSRAQRKVQDLTILYSCVRPRLLHYGILSLPQPNLIVSTGFATIDLNDKDLRVPSSRPFF